MDISLILTSVVDGSSTLKNQKPVMAEEKEKSKFKIIEEFNGIHHDKIQAFSRNCHLKSLFYSNNYAIHPTP